MIQGWLVHNKIKHANGEISLRFDSLREGMEWDS